ncbi:MAG: YraN family protein [Treponema sp.]|nr:YraN family protein [Treponema sp.]
MIRAETGRDPPIAAAKSPLSRGREGEDRAAAEIEKRGLSLVARNVRSPWGEVDLVALDGETLVFIEVKNWPIYGIADLEYSITGEKQRRIIETAKYFLRTHREYSDRPIRFDVFFLQPGKPARHLESAFMDME